MLGGNIYVIDKRLNSVSQAKGCQCSREGVSDSKTVNAVKVLFSQEVCPIERISPGVVSWSAVDVDVDDEDFNLIQPSLIQQLRKILDEYPDDGQILKVRHFNCIILLFIFYLFQLLRWLWMFVDIGSWENAKACSNWIKTKGRKVCIYNGADILYVRQLKIIALLGVW